MGASGKWWRCRHCKLWLQTLKSENYLPMEDGRIGCLVVGSPRSGTTLCAAMIGAHPDIGMHSEDIRHTPETILGVKIWGNKLCIPNQITLDPRPDDRSLWTRLEDGVRAVIGRPRRLPQQTESYPPPSSAQYTIRKYIESGARIVAMLRDPDHVVDSIRRRGVASVEEGKERWSRAIRAIHQVHEEYEDRVCLIRFADLVTDPEPVMKEVCALLEIDYSPRMPEGYKYTPQYHHDQLDASVAKRNVRGYNVRRYDSEALKCIKNSQEKVGGRHNIFLLTTLCALRMRPPSDVGMLLE